VAAKPAAPTATVVPVPTKPAATATAAPLPVAAVGQRVASGGVVLTVNSVRKAPRAGVFAKAKEGRVLLVADVTVENAERDTAPYNPLYFKVKDAEGFEYGSFVGVDDGLKSGELPKGDKARGVVAFEVRTDAKGFVLSYQPIVLFGGYRTIRVGLGD
jgi:hypothetical protein